MEGIHFIYCFQDIERVCSLPQSVVSAAFQKEQLIPTTSVNGDNDDAEVAPSYSLLTLSVGKQEYRVLYADFSSPLLTSDTFLVEKKKVRILFWLLTHLLYHF